MLTVLAVISAFSCNVNNLPHEIDEAESFIRHDPARAKAILEDASRYRKGNRRERASWCLMNVWAKYNAYDNDLSPEQRARYMADAIHPTRAGYEEWWLPKFMAAVAAVPRTIAAAPDHLRH